MATENNSTAITSRRDFFKKFVGLNHDNDDGDVAIPPAPEKGIQPGKNLFYILNRLTLSRRRFLRDTGLAGGVLTASPVIEFAEHFDRESALREKLEQLLEGRNVSVSVTQIDLKTGKKDSEVSINKERKLPVASAFKAMVLLFYLENVPPEEWSFDKGSDVYNMIVYSHNKATGQVLHDASEAVKQTASDAEDKNDLELFNDYLESIGVGGILSAWGFDSSVEGQIDNRYAHRKVKTADGKEVMADNLANAEQLQAFYEYLIDKRLNSDSQDNLPFEVFTYLASLCDLRYLSPLETEFLGHNFFGKDGYLTSDTWKDVGATKVDAGVLQISPDKALIVSISSFDESEMLINEASEIIGSHYLGDKSIPYDDDASLFKLSNRAKATIAKKMPGKFTGIEEVDCEGLIEPEAKDVNFLNEVTMALEKKPLGMVITVNLYTGEMGAFEVSESGSSTQTVFKKTVLTGERLPYGKTSDEKAKLEKRFADSRFSANGRYDGQKGVFFSSSEQQLPRHSLTRPMICIFEGSSAANGFGGLDTSRPVPFFVMKMLTEGEMDHKWSKSNLNSQTTIHAVPNLPSTDKAHDHYATRAKMLQIVNELANKGLKRPEGFDSNWSHACINMAQGDYSELLTLANQVRSDGKSVAVVLSYTDQNWENLVLKANFSEKNDPFYGENLGISLGKGFESF